MFWKYDACLWHMFERVCNWPWIYDFHIDFQQCKHQDFHHKFWYFSFYHEVHDHLAMQFIIKIKKKLMLLWLKIKILIVYSFTHSIQYISEWTSYFQNQKIRKMRHLPCLSHTAPFWYSRKCLSLDIVLVCKLICWSD